MSTLNIRISFVSSSSSFPLIPFFQRALTYCDLKDSEIVAQLTPESQADIAKTPLEAQEYIAPFFGLPSIYYNITLAYPVALLLTVIGLIIVWAPCCLKSVRTQILDHIARVLALFAGLLTTTIILCNIIFVHKTGGNIQVNMAYPTMLGFCATLILFVFVIWYPVCRVWHHCQNDTERPTEDYEKLHCCTPGSCPEIDSISQTTCIY